MRFGPCVVWPRLRRGSTGSSEPDGHSARQAAGQEQHISGPHHPGRVPSVLSSPSCFPRRTRWSALV